MKNLPLLFGLLVLLTACKSSFKRATTEFEPHFSEGLKNLPPESLIPFCDEGWFELRVREVHDTIEGVEVPTLQIAPDLDVARQADPTQISFEFSSYFAFIDPQRVVFFTPFRYEQDVKTFNLQDEKLPDFQRGYYYYQPAVIQEEPGILFMSLENKKRRRKTDLVFETVLKDGRLHALRLIQMNGRNETPIASQGPQIRIYSAADLFQIEPTYFFNPDRSLKLVAGQNPVDQIALDTVSMRRTYLFQNNPVFQESLREESDVRTW